MPPLGTDDLKALRVIYNSGLVSKFDVTRMSGLNDVAADKALKNLKDYGLVTVQSGVSSGSLSSTYVALFPSKREETERELSVG
jgi:hypothetical protein